MREAILLSTTNTEHHLDSNPGGLPEETLASPAPTSPAPASTAAASTAAAASPTIHRPAAEPADPLTDAEDESFEPLAGRAPVREDSPLFADLGVDPVIGQALADVGITRTFAIQALTLPIALGGSDLIGQARTGTGKTLGFGVPLLQRITPGGDLPQALVVVPTRELCIQVTRDLQAAGRHRGVRCTSIYGGRAYEPQVNALRRGVDVVVGTPGRLLDLATQRHLRLGAVSILVLDEADEMLDLGFLPDIERILAQVPSNRQTMLFSATMPGPIVALARRFMRQPVHIRAEGHDESTVVPTTAQFVYRAHALDKLEMLARILQAGGRGLTMIFCRTKRTAAKVADDLVERGFAAAAVHGDLGQGAREQALRAFRSGKVDVLVATDVAARGLDVEDVTHVINYQCPEDEKVYLHRIGRTARAGKSGTAVTLVDWDELARWRMICDALKLPLHEPPETYSTSEHLYIDLDIPAEAGHNLPAARRVRAGLDAEEVEDVGETGRRGAVPGRSKRRRSPDPSGPPRRAAGGEAASTSEDDGPGTGRLPRRRRPRRRTRGGQPVTAGPVDSSVEAPLDGSVEGPVDGSVEAPLDGSVEGPVDGSVEAGAGSGGAEPGSGAAGGSGQPSAAPAAEPRSARRRRATTRSGAPSATTRRPGPVDSPAGGPVDQPANDVVGDPVEETGPRPDAGPDDAAESQRGGPRRRRRRGRGGRDHAERVSANATAESVPTHH